MPILLVPFIVVATLAFVGLLIPVSLVLRYRVATSRRRARGWMAAVNVFGFAISAASLVGVAMVTSIGDPRALPYVGMGFGGGVLLGLLGLATTRWDDGDGRLYFTSNRPLVLLVSLVVAGRIVYGLWRAWSVWPGDGGGETWIAEAGVAGSLAAGAVFVGYSFVYWAGIRRRLRWPARR